MRLDLDDKTGKLTLPSAKKSAEVLRAAATVERLLIVTGDVELEDSAASTLEAHAAMFEEDASLEETTPDDGAGDEVDE